MRLLTLLLLCASLTVFSQPRKDSFVSVNYGLDSTDFQQIFSGLLGIDVSKYYIPSTFSKYHCDFLVEEYYEGTMVKKESLKDSLPAVATFALNIGKYLERGKFKLFFYSQKLDTTLKLYLSIGGAGIHKKYSLLPREAYSWKEVYDPELKKHKLRPGEEFPLLVYTTAIGKDHSSYGDNVAEFCRISGELIPPKDWHKDLGIKHFYLFSIKLVK
jgi:hypothetical protein